MYVELHARSAFSLLDGASLPETLARRAANLGMTSLALTDRDDLGGAVRFMEGCAEHGVRPIFGAELSLDVGGTVVLLCESAEGWSSLSQLITKARMERPRGRPGVSLDALAGQARGLVCLSGGRDGALELASDPEALAGGLAEIFRGGFYVEVGDHALTEDVLRARERLDLACRLSVPWVVAGDVRHATSADKIVGPPRSRRRPPRAGRSTRGRRSGSDSPPPAGRGSGSRGCRRARWSSSERSRGCPGWRRAGRGSRTRCRRTRR